MRVELKKFGLILTSRPSGREAFLAAQSYLLPKNAKEIVEINFTGVAVLSPSWADEFLTPLKKKYGQNLKLLPTNNQSVRETLKTIGLDGMN